MVIYFPLASGRHKQNCRRQIKKAAMTWISLATLLVITMSTCSVSAVELSNNGYNNTASLLQFSEGVSMMQHDPDMGFLMDSSTSSSLAIEFKEPVTQTTGSPNQPAVNCDRGKAEGKPYIVCLPKSNPPPKIPEHCNPIYKENLNRACD